MDNPQPIPGGTPGAGTPPQNFGSGQAPAPKPFTPSTGSGQVPPPTPAPRPFMPASTPPPVPRPFTPPTPSTGSGQVPPSPVMTPRPAPTPPPNIPMGPSTGSGDRMGVEVRTMASDIKSVQETGGGAPRPYVPPQVPGSIQEKGISAMPPMPPKGDVKPSSAPSPMGGPAKKPSRRSKKGIFTLIISFIIVVGAGVIGYFFVFPLFGGDGTPAPSAPVTQTLPPVVTPTLPQEDAGLFDIPSGVAPEEVTTPPTEEPEPVVSAPPATPTHISYLSLPSDLTSNVVIEDVTASALRERVGFKTAQVASLKEIVFTRDGSPLQLRDLGQGLLPQFFTAQVASLFEDDFTYVVYTDAKGSWPVYVFRLRSGADAASAKSTFAAIEQTSAGDLGNLYLSSPGGASTWKDGKVLGTAGRYNAFTLSGASLNYLLIDNFVVLGTNYAAIQEAVKRL